MRKSYGAAFLVLSGAGIAIGFLIGGQRANAAAPQAVAPRTTSVTPGWECVPTTVGAAVVSGGTGAAPSCTIGTTAVLAPTFVSSGVGGKPTVEFSSVNVQIVSGSGSTTGAVNAEGNLVVGYAENTNKHPQTGSNNLIVGSNNGWNSYGAIIGGFANQALSPYATVVGADNSASGGYNLVAGYHNKATGAEATATGGRYNLASGSGSAVVGGCENVAGAGTNPSGTCGTDVQSVLGGFENTASGFEATVSGGGAGTASGEASSVSGGQLNNATGGDASVSGGESSDASGTFASISGGLNNAATALHTSVSGGNGNTAQNTDASILGGEGNSTAAICQAIPAAPEAC